MSDPSLPDTPRMNAITAEVKRLVQVQVAVLAETGFDPEVEELTTVARAFAESILASNDTSFAGLVHAFIGGVFWERGRSGLERKK